MFADQLADVRRRIQQACQRSRRDPSTVTLVAVTKGMPASAIREAAAQGLTDIGENRVQEAREKQEELGARRKARWHLIGHLQRNKAKLAVELFDVIHSVDSVALAEVLEREAAKQHRLLDIFLQVNVSGETTKFGCAPEAAAVVAQAIQRCSHLQLHGLMTMAPFSDAPEDSRPYFRRLRQLRDAIAADCRLPTADLHLSMGMSQDFEVAIEEGADYVRIGTALFGARV